MDPSLIEQAALQVTARPIPNEVLVNAFRAQQRRRMSGDGHYIADEMIELMGHAGVGAVTGNAIAFRGPDAPAFGQLAADLLEEDDDGSVTPALIERVVDDYCVVFWGPGAISEKRCTALAALPATEAAFAAACERWGMKPESEWTWDLSGGRSTQRFPYEYPWTSGGWSSWPVRWYSETLANKRKRKNGWAHNPVSAAQEHLDRLRAGDALMVAPLAAGRLLLASIEVIEIDWSTWMAVLRKGRT